MYKPDRFFLFCLFIFFILYEKNRDLFVSEQNKCNNKMIVFISLNYWMMINCYINCYLICTPWSLCHTLVNMSSKYFIAVGYWGSTGRSHPSSSEIQMLLRTQPASTEFSRSVRSNISICLFSLQNLFLSIQRPFE